jgi:tight adherence protein B
LARASRGGASLQQALRTVPPPVAVAGCLGPVTLALQRGVPLAAALATAAGGPAHLDLVLVVLRTCAEQGGSPAEPIDRAATALRQRAAMIAERRTHSAQARMSAIVMTSLPGAMLTVLLVSSTSVRGSAFSPLGAVVLAIGAALNLAGWAWMRHIISGVGR